VPRRNNGPIVTPVDPTVGGPALSVQFTGFSPTREFDTFRTWNRARNLDEFKSGFDTFDFGSQNWAYADVDGNIAYFTSAEVPVREDLQNNTVDGLPPFFIRDGTGGNEWVRDDDRKLGQAIPFEILPFEEMPQIVNPPAGYFVNANNDPTGLTRDNDPLNQFRPGGGIFYLNPGYDLGLRAGRITRLMQEQLAQDKVTLEDMQAIQADVVLSDAEFFVPFIAAAFENANAPAAHPALAVFTLDPRVRAAVGRLADWQANPAAPTGIPEGYDASDIDGVRLAPTPEEIDDSIAATIYSMWRGRLINNTIDAVLDALGGLPRPDSQQAMTALRNLFEKEEPGRGASGLEFFAPSLTGVPATVRRDLVVLQSLTDALDRLASDDFAPAFNNSTDQNDYRWGLLHRIVLDHPLNGPFDVPPAGGAFPPPLPGLAGIPVDGGFEVVDASRHSARAEDLDDFMFGSGPTRRFVAEMISGRGDHDDDGDEGRNRGIDAVSSLPGGESGVLGDPRYVNLLESWLTNETHPLRQRLGEILPDTQRRDLLLPQ